MTESTFDPAKKPIISGIGSPQPEKWDGPPDSKVEILEIKGEHMKLNVNAAAPGILWTTDMHYPGWKVNVDGEKSPLLRVNYAFRGVALPAGNHAVEFLYESAPFRNGSALFFIGVSLIVSGYLIKANWKGRSKRNSPASEVPTEAGKKYV